jgi:hypothetical protein
MNLNTISLANKKTQTNILKFVLTKKDAHKLQHVGKYVLKKWASPMMTLQLQARSGEPGLVALCKAIKGTHP